MTHQDQTVECTLT